MAEECSRHAIWSIEVGGMLIRGKKVFEKRREGELGRKDRHMLRRGLVSDGPTGFDAGVS